MKSGRTWALVRRNLGRRRRTVVSSAFGVSVGIACLVFFVSLGTGVSQFVRQRVLPLDETLIEVGLPDVSIGALFGGGKIDDGTLARLKAIEGVARVYPKMDVRVPISSRYNGDFFGQPLRMGVDIMTVGVDPALMEGAVMPGRTFADAGDGQPVPVIASTRLLDIYNTSFAPSRGMPRLFPEMLNGFRLPVDVGRSLVSGASGTVESVPFEFSGFSPHAILGGVNIPLESAKRLNRKFGRDATIYSGVLLRASRADAIGSISEAVRRMGFDVRDSDRKFAEQIGWGIALVTAAFGLLALLIVVLAGVNIAHAFHASVRERRREIGVLRALGASRRDVLRVLLLEGAAVGLLGGLTGVVVGAFATWGCNVAFMKMLGSLPMKPDALFVISLPVLVAGLVLGVLAAVVGAFGPAWSAARLEPAAALAE